jgi:hypothetical protein
VQREIAHRLDRALRGREVHRQLLYVENPGQPRTVQCRSPGIPVPEAHTKVCVMSITHGLCGESIRTTGSRDSVSKPDA